MSSNFPTPQWNAAALLNPRSLHQRPQQRPEHSQPTTTIARQELAFQFDSPGGSSQQNPYTLYQQNGNGAYGSANSGFASYANNGVGASHMLERMHNVAERDVLSQKRRKVHDNRPEGGATFSGGKSSGDLGEYMRQQERQQPAARVNPVYISAAEDEDLVVLDDPGDKEVCYGRIENAEINAHQVPTPREGVQSLTPGFWPQVKIVLRRKVGERTSNILAVDSTRQIIGCVDVNTSIGLAPLLDHAKFNIRTSTRILSRPKRDSDPPPGAEVSRRYALDLNLYGPKRFAEPVGKHLSQKQIWLRHPMYVEAGIELHNPHQLLKRPQEQMSRQFSANGGSSLQGTVRTTEEIRNEVLGMFDSLEKSENLPEMEPDSRITTELLKHQKQGLYFMTNKEKERTMTTDDKGNGSLWRVRTHGNGQQVYYNVITGQSVARSPPQVLGGLLADMMGLGKTLSILSLIMTTLDEATEWAQLAPSAPEPISQCRSKRGRGEPLPVVDLAPLSQNSKATLLVSPLSTIANWEEQIKQHVKPDSLRYYIYHGASRTKDAKKLSEYDLVITTYGSVAGEFNHRSKKKQGKYPLEEINWFRIVLDEAHMIREQSTQQSKAICRLSAQRRWAVTGTPVQNRLEDLGALTAFLRIKPFDEKGGFAQYIMAPFKMCDPDVLPKLRLLVNSITLRRLKDRIDLPKRHDKLVRLQFTEEEGAVYNIFAKNAKDRLQVIMGQGENNLGGKSYAHILRSILRLRLICAHGRDMLSEEDQKVMNGLSKDNAIDLDSDEEDNRPTLTPKEAYDMYNLMKETGADVCFQCSRKIGPSEAAESDEGKDEIIGHMTPCYHILCNTCIKKYNSELEAVAKDSQAICPFCNQQIKLSYFALRQVGVEEDEEDRMQTKGSQKPKRITTYSGPHSKTKALLHDLLASKHESEMNPTEPPFKSVVFSGWTTHLDLIQIALQDHGITFTRLDGRMTRTARSAAMETFRDDPSIHVILVTISAGGLGLNLTTANKVYVMEPQYNPAAEAQAIDRVHRLGQKRDVETVRYIMKGSFEEKMLELQEKKKKLAQLSMDSEGRRMDKAEATKKRLEDIRSLFK